MATTTHTHHWAIIYIYVYVYIYIYSSRNCLTSFIMLQHILFITICVRFVPRYVYHSIIVSGSRSPNYLCVGSCILLRTPVRTWPTRSLAGCRFIHTHTTLSHTTLPHTTLSHTTLSQTTLSQTALSNTTLSHTALSRTTLSQTTISHTALSHTSLSLRRNSVTHTHTSFSPASLSHTHTQLFYTQLFRTTLLHTICSQKTLLHKTLSHTTFHARPFHRQHCQAQPFLVTRKHNPFSTISYAFLLFPSHVHICFVLIGVIGGSWPVGLSGPEMPHIVDEFLGPILQVE